jgi:hypothetical protein
MEQGTIFEESDGYFFRPGVQEYRCSTTVYGSETSPIATISAQPASESSSEFRTSLTTGNYSC